MKTPLPEITPCECSPPEGGWQPGQVIQCKRYGITQTEHTWRICSGHCTEERPCTAEMTQRYQSKWARRRDGVETPIHRPSASTSTRTTPAQKKPRATPPQPRGRPGTKLKGVFASLGIQAEKKKGCGCPELANQMDAWGIEGCRLRECAIIERLREQQAKMGWLETLRVAFLATVNGLAFKLDPLDPAPGLFAEAMRQAEADESSAS